MPTDLSISEAADRLGVSTKTVRRRLDAGQYPSAYRAGARGEWMIPADELGDANVSTIPVHVSMDTAPAVSNPEPAAPIAGPILLTVDQVAGILGITVYAVRAAIRRDQLQALPWGPKGSHLIPAAEIRRLAGL